MHETRRHSSPGRTSETGPQQQTWSGLLFWLFVVAAVSVSGYLVTQPKIPTWYADLVKPPLTPPNAIFGPVWTVLYVLMAVAIWRVAVAANGAAGFRATVLFNVQLALNALWSPVFFGLQAPVAGLVVLVALVAALVTTIMAFWRLDRLAAGLLMPYLLWVCYAAWLNAAIAVLN